MSPWFDSIRLLPMQFPTLFAQNNDTAVGDVFKNIYKATPLDPSILISFMVIMVSFVALIAYGTYRYQRWKRYMEFEEEMKTLDLGTDSEGTLAGMVKRFNMDEPVNILFSVRLFDEMAVSEIMRVLASPGSTQAKQSFIDAVYKIRIKTYHPEWLAPVEDPSILFDKAAKLENATEKKMSRV